MSLPLSERNILNPHSWNTCIVVVAISSAAAAKYLHHATYPFLQTTFRKKMLFLTQYPTMPPHSNKVPNFQHLENSKYLAASCHDIPGARRSSDCLSAPVGTCQSEHRERSCITRRGGREGRGGVGGQSGWRAAASAGSQQFSETCQFFSDFLKQPFISGWCECWQREKKDKPSKTNSLLVSFFI